MYFGSALDGDDVRIVVASQDKSKFFYLDDIAKICGFEAQSDMVSFINEHTDAVIAMIRDHIEKEPSAIHDPDSLAMLAAIPHPLRNVFCVGTNYADHVREIKDNFGIPRELPKAPVYFSKAAFFSSGPDDEVSAYSGDGALVDYEAELIAVIGSPAVKVSGASADDVIFGYAAGQDISVRNIQNGRGQWFLGKSHDSHFVMGAWIAHKSMIPTPVDLEIKCFVNGELRQKSSTSHMIFDIAHILEDLTAYIALYPGDMIMTGTPSGVGHATKNYLKAGDIVTTEIESVDTFSVTICE